MAKGQAKQKKPEPCSFIIFGVTGDLTHRLVIPALYNLAASNLLPENFCVAGVARKGVSGNALRNSLMDGLRKFATRPVDDEIASLVPYRGARGSFPYISFADIWSDKAPAEALRGNRSLTVMNHPDGRHAFDIVDDTDTSRAVIASIVEFMAIHLSIHDH